MSQLRVQPYQFSYYDQGLGYDRFIDIEHFELAHRVLQLSSDQGNEKPLPPATQTNLDVIFNSGTPMSNLNNMLIYEVSFEGTIGFHVDKEWFDHFQAANEEEGVDILFSLASPEGVEIDASMWSFISNYNCRLQLQVSS